MADSSIEITAGSGNSIDTRTEATNGNHRQVVVIGDASTNAGIAPVDVTNGLSVTLTTALPAGTNAFGKLSANSGVDIGDVDVTSAVITSGTITTVSSLTGGGVAHDGVDSGNPLKIGAKAVDLGATPTAVAAADRTDLLATRAGQQFVIGGHPNIITKNFQVTDADGAQTDADILGAIGAGTAVVVTQVSVNADNANTVDVSCRIGFGTANTPAADAAGVIFFHPGIPAGGGQGIGTGAGIIGIGASGEELRVTCEDPVTGSISIQVTYYTIAIG